LDRIRAIVGAPRVRLVAGMMGLLVIGGVLGAVIATAVPALAANGSAGGVTAATATGPSKYCQIYEQTLESKLNTSQQQLESANQAAITAALQQAVKDGKLTQGQANRIEQRVAANSTNICAHLGGLLQRLQGARGQRGFLKQAFQAILSAVATRLNIPVDTLRSDLAGGQSIVSLAAQHGVSQSALNATILSAVRSQLDAAVSQHLLTTQQETRLITLVTAQINAGNYGVVGLGSMSPGQ
jgi:hypothetical protein